MNVRRTRDLPRERLNVVPRHASTRKRSRDCQARQAPSAPSVVASSGLDGLLRFEALCEARADKLVGWDKPWAAFTPIFRALEHSRALQTLMHRSFANTPELQRLGFAFSELQEAREWADYNPEPRPNFDATRNSPPFTRSETYTPIELAEEAVQILDRLDEETRLQLVTGLVTKSRK